MKFEYKLAHYKAEGWMSGGKVDVNKIEDEYNAHGQDGWELVSVMDTNKNREMVATGEGLSDDSPTQIHYRNPEGE